METDIKNRITPTIDHAACGVGFIAREDGVASHQVLVDGLCGLKKNEHRGGVGGDGKTSDGTGILIDLDQDFFSDKYAEVSGTSLEDGQRLGVGVVFLPSDNEDAKNQYMSLIEAELANAGFEGAVWRDRPVDESVLGPDAIANRPEMKEILIPQSAGQDAQAFERALFFARKKIEHAVSESPGKGADAFYIPTMSSKSIGYKGLSIAQDLPTLYPDLQDERVKTASVMFHRRFSTNTEPAWARSHPYRVLAHNGEINSLLTNINMSGRIERVFGALYPEEDLSALFPILQQGGTDSAMLDNAAEFLMHAGLSGPTIKMLLVPEAFGPNTELSEDVQAAYNFIDTLVEPWDGPNTTIIRDANSITVGGDRNGYRPVRYYRTDQGYVVAGSEDGMITDIGTVFEKGNLNPGEMLSVNFDDQSVVYSTELKARAAAELKQIFGYDQVLDQIHALEQTKISMDDYSFVTPDMKAERRRRQRLGYMNIETLEFLEAMAEKGKEPLGSMGDTTATTISSPIVRPVSHFFQQKFAQVTNPPIDSIRERSVMSLKTTIGFPFDRDGDLTKEQIITVDSPLLLSGELTALRAKIGEERIEEMDTTFDPDAGPDALNDALKELQEKAIHAVKNGYHIVLTDEYTDENRVAVPPLLAVGAVNTALIDAGLRNNTSLHVRSAEAFASHDLATLVGLGGADTVNAYMAEETIVAQHNLQIYRFNDTFSSFGARTPLEQFVKLYEVTGHEATNVANERKMAALHKGDAGAAEFFAEHGKTTLQELASNSDDAVRDKFYEIMGKLDVNIDGLFESQSIDSSLNTWKGAVESGLLKVMGKMGVAHVSSYRSGRLFESLGLSEDVIEACFPGVASPMGGLSMAQLQERVVRHHDTQYEKDYNRPLDHIGRYKFRSGKNAEPHVLNAEAIELFQDAVKDGDVEKYNAYRDLLIERAQTHRFDPRDWLGFKSGRQAVALDDVESAEDIMHRFFTGGMSDGSLGEEAHTTLAVAMNKIGGKSCSGEGGEHPMRYGRDNPMRSKMKQLASGRFGTSIDYMLNADVIQIKMAQGAKPGEGGELPGHKVNARIAFLRNCEQGTTLISPPPHHDIYSIEDLEQLIYDIKEVNPDARVDVKLVASEGVDIVAAGVAKAGADSIHIGGSTGGTGASPQLSMPHAGMRWETAVNRVHQRLSSQGLRERVTLTTDGGMRIGRDIVVAAMMGAEEYGYGLQALIAEGCKLVRSCQNNDCPFGVATTDEELRKKFIGTPEMVENMMRMIAEDVRETLSELGLKSIDEAIGRVDLLEQVWGQDLGLSFDTVLPGWKAEVTDQKCTLEDGQRNDRVDPQNPNRISIDEKMIAAAGGTDAITVKLLLGEQWAVESDIENEDRVVGTRISGRVLGALNDYFAKAAGNTSEGLAHYKNGKVTLDEDSIRLSVKGVAGQSAGAWLMNGMTLNIEGGANDGVGKSLSGGKIVIRPDQGGPIAGNTQDNVILGNTPLYGATAGELYAAGRAGNRFAMRLSGATAVAEGAGTHACNYMTAGIAVILDDVGHNFGSGMSGGTAFVYDRQDTLTSRSHKDVKAKIRSVNDNEADQLKSIIQKHFDETASLYAKSLLDDWDNAVAHFKVVHGNAPAAQRGGQALEVVVA
ncbi:MAG: hypothetical protein JKY71_06055 [Alphaproteobacteria bacterium]|nr:hypothetical protein [Alphaproteobacteria bacterium]